MNLFDFKKKVAEAFPNAESISANVEYWWHGRGESLKFRCNVSLPGGVFYNSSYDCLSFEEAFDTLLKAAGRHPSQFAAMQAGNEEFARQGFVKEEKANV